MTKSKEDAVLLLGKLYESQDSLASLCSEFEFESDEARHAFSKTVGHMLGYLFEGILRPIYRKYPELTPPTLKDSLGKREKSIPPANVHEKRLG
jgi:hypothetical protein